MILLNNNLHYNQLIASWEQNSYYGCPSCLTVSTTVRQLVRPQAESAVMAIHGIAPHVGELALKWNYG
jgi:hypothetical protein